MRIVATIIAVIAVGTAAPASAGVVITVDKTAQHLSVSVDGRPRYEWAVSTARDGYRTPNGTYRPERLERQWFSRKYDWSPMPHSIFFSGGYAIHGSYEVSRLGRPASHGCIRLHPSNAATLFSLVQANTKDTRIIITGGSEPLVASRRGRTRYSTAESYDTRSVSSSRVTYESTETRPPRNYELRSYEMRNTGRRSSSFEDIFDEPRSRR